MPDTIKALTLWQPWASLIAIGAKRYETHSWSTGYRGPLAIHSAKRWTKDQRAFCTKEITLDALCTEGDFHPSDVSKADTCLPLGKVVAVVNLKATRNTEHLSNLSRKEQYFGNYGSSRYGWELDNIRRMEKPVPVRGHQGLWNLDRNLIANS